MSVFISHSSTDKPIARRISHSLEAAGISTWLDEVEIRVGHSIPEKIAEGIESSGVLCILLSQSSVNSPWVTRELNAYLPRFIRMDGAVLPCRLDDASLPVLIADLKYADFSTSFDIGIAELFQGFRIREQIEFRQMVRAKIAELEAKFPQLTLALLADQPVDGFFMAHTDYEGDRAKFVFLNALERCGIFQVTTDRYEHCFTFTTLGRAVAAELFNHVNVA